MPKSSRRSKTALFLALSTLLAPCLGGTSLVRAQTDLPTFGPLACPGQSTAYPNNSMICTMTIQIFNDDANHFIFPVLEMGQGQIDKWMQAWFSIHNDQLPTNPFPRNNTYRIYINPTNGIAPKAGVSLTLPLFTALKTIPNPMTQAFSNPGTGLGMPDTFIDWWSGGNIQLYTSPGTMSAPQPLSLTNELKRPLTQQKPLSVPWDPSAPPAPTAGGPPTCTPVKSKAPNAPDPAAKCEDLIIYVDTGGIGKQGGSQLLEYTLGAVNANQSPQNVTSWINYWLDTHNVDFDISYVDVAWMPGVMGVFGNDQVGYTGTPQSVNDFSLGPCPTPGDQSCAENQRKGGLTAFKNGADTMGWPQYRDTFANLNPPPPPLPADPCSGADRKVPCVTYLKFPSPIDVFSPLADSVSGGAPPPDFFPVPNSTDWKAGPPAALNAWPPIKTLYNKWIAAVGTVEKPRTTTCGTQTYRPGTPINDWCTAMRAQKTILLANYEKYVELVNRGKCPPAKTPVPLSDARLMGHLYGFSPWIEGGCNADFNLLQDTPAPSDLPRSTPGFCVDITKGACPTVDNPLGGAADQRNYTNYQIVKTAFDKLNYGPLANPPLPNPRYTFNPWVELIHADPSKAGNPAYGLNMPCSYAYSVDDAQGNVQAEGRGFILDISSTVNLKNIHPCSPPISISLGYLPNVTPRFYKYAVCKQTDEVLNDRVKPIIPGFASFVIGAQNPANCPIFVWDNVVSGGKNSQPPIPVVEDKDPSGPPLGQMYTFRINGGTTLFPLFTLPKSGKFFPCNPRQQRPDCAPDWSHANHDIIGCMGDVPPKGPNDPTSNPPYSSQIWCCNSAANAGVFVFSEPVTGAAHKTFNYNASARAAMTCTDKASCNRDNTIGNSTPCNTTF